MVYANDGVINPNNNWMYMGMYEWTISRDSGYSGYAFYVLFDGRVSGTYVNTALAVRPSFSLSSSVMYLEGDGSIENPFRIKV